MMRKVLSLAALLMSMLFANAQMPQLTPLPLNPAVKSGVLPNGLSYYILHNEEPKERANFYIAQKVGSTLETQEQLGLAHFLEHMAFNGTTHYPGKNMLDYLQHKGIRFGADINAYTSFDETVYNIDNVPTTDQPLMDSVLLILRDWSCDLLLEDAEIDAERGVIQEEWRQRNDANTRMFTAILPQIYKEYQYQQMPIGKMEVVMNFKPQVLRDYYEKWYRPDQQGIVIVGDFDADAMEAKVKEMFSTIEMPKNAAKRTYPEVSDNKNLIYATFQDPELQVARMTVSFKSDKTPFEYRNTAEVYMQDILLEQIISALINNRLTEAAQNPDCAYAHAGCYFDDFYVSKTKDSFNVVIIPKKDMTAAFNEAMGIVARACKTGFTDSEYARVKSEMLANYERLYNERDKTKTSTLAQELIRHFVDNEPAPGIATEFELVKQVLAMLPVEAINQICAQGMLPSENQVVVYSQPTGAGEIVITEQVMGQMLKDVLNAKYEAYVDEVITDPLIAALPKPGSVTKRVENPEFGTTELTLSNGVKVIVKTTDFNADQIVMTAWKEGGKRTYSTSQAADVLLMEDVYDLSTWGPFDGVKLKKYLAGKQVSLGYSLGNYTNSLTGSSTVKDLPTLMELIYTSFTNLSPDLNAYKAQMDQARVILENQDKNPQKIFFDQVAKVRYNNNPLMENVTVATLDAANYDTMLDMVKKSLANAAEYTFVFTGNVELNELIPLLNQYIATLPVARRQKVVDETSLAMVEGQVEKKFEQAMQAPSTYVYDLYSGHNLEYNVRNTQLVELTADILDIIYTETLREEMGGTYGASVAGMMNPNTKEWQILYFFQTNKDQQSDMIKRAHAELEKLLKEGAKPEHFNKVKEAAIKQLELQERNNGYWVNGLMLAERGYNTLTGAAESLKGITLDDLNGFMKGLYDGKNRIQVIMEGTPAE